MADTTFTYLAPSTVQLMMVGTTCPQPHHAIQSRGLPRGSLSLAALLLPVLRKVKDPATCQNENVTMTRKVLTLSDDYVTTVGPITLHSVIHVSTSAFFTPLTFAYITLQSYRSTSKSM
ncbi:hypothetical protein RJT34_08369 [Clitoria ternatea]|uniref:Uncharacterized protein n=1 Tax=Clitoria ternatea TaxID=43366 RepID=A0AAN9PSR2_CLITE